MFCAQIKKNLKHFEKQTFGLRLRSTSSLTMDGVITTISNGKRTTSPIKNISQVKRSKFVGITPLKELTNVTKPTDRPFRVSVEGNIGAGKSTFIKYFSTFDGLETYPEPIDWWRNVDGHNLLDLLYKDIKKWYNTFQMYVQLTRLTVQTSKPSSPSTRVQMFERSVQNNRFCFVEQARNNGLLAEPDYAILDKWYRFIREQVDIKLDLIVYLRSSPEVVYERTKARGRPEETGITLEYLQQLHDSHETWLMSDNERFNATPVLVLDADKTLDDIIEQYKLNEKKILGFDMKENFDDKKRVKKVLKMDM